MLGDCSPATARIRTGVNLSTGCAEIDAALVYRIDSHGVAQHVNVAIVLGKALGQSFPFVSALAAPEHLELSVQRIMFTVALDWDNINRFRLMRMNLDDEAEIGGKIAADF